MGATVFAVKDGGKCLVAEPEDDYQENGASKRCQNGEGAEDAVSVYTTQTGQFLELQSQVARNYHPARSDPQELWMDSGQLGVIILSAQQRVGQELDNVQGLAPILALAMVARIVLGIARKHQHATLRDAQVRDLTFLSPKNAFVSDSLYFSIQSMEVGVLGLSGQVAMTSVD